MKSLLTLSSFIFLIFTSFSQIVEIYPMQNNMTNDVNLVKDILYTHYKIEAKLNYFNYYLPQNQSIDCDELNLKINGTKDFKYNKDKPIKLYLTTSKILSLNSKVHGVTYGNHIYIRTLRKEKIALILIHELSHTFGLYHCENICIMNPQYNPRKKEEIWDRNNDLPIFCDQCKQKIKVN